ncbi:MAG: lysophospholipid acyltransferase family protein [Candidatus Rokubacteria bacterium]|nr:lysophospholipid acyltransferase family protein [Candidatus Rokubacteria bacterium]
MVTSIAGLAGRLPLPFALVLGRRLGDLVWLLLRSRRRLALANVAVAFPDLPAADRRQIARRSFQHLGMVVAEVCRALRDPVEATLDRVNVDGLEYVKGVMAVHGRALLVSAHLGNWELLTLAYRVSGFPLSVVVRPLDAPAVAGVMRRLRAAGGANMIAKRDALRPVLEALRGGHLVAILLDQNASRREGVFVPFFGRLASTSRSVATLAIRTGTPIMPLFIRREPDGRHRITVRPPIMPNAATSDDAVTELTRRCTAAIETAVREAPDQWLWMHARWRTRPAGERRPS